MLSENSHSLLNYAISKLSPEVFSHPVWRRFGGKRVCNQPMIDNLRDAAKHLQADDPSSACQILLLCAVCQTQCGQHEEALQSTQQVLAMASASNLTREIIWAIWGACAVSLEQGNYEETTKQLEDLQATFNASNEWVLANLIDVLKQAIFQPVSVPVRKTWQSPRTQPFGDAIAVILDELQYWGISQHELGEELEETHLDQILYASQGLAPEQTVSHSSAPITINQHPEPINSVVSISVHMLGTFSITIADSTVKLPASRATSLLKYLLLHHKQTTPREVLMDIFWPDADLEIARNNLNVSLHSLRRALRTTTDLPVIIFEDGAYGLAHNIQIWMDVEEFERCVKAGQGLEARNQPTAAIAEYEAAVSLYQGDLLEQNPYEEWTVLDRERLRIAYLDTLDHLSQIYFMEERYSACRSACQLILSRDPCREDAHSLLMRCYSRQRQHHLALYQYQVCVEALRMELGVEPAPETTQLYNRIRRREPV